MSRAKLGDGEAWRENEAAASARGGVIKCRECGGQWYCYCAIDSNARPPGESRCGVSSGNEARRPENSGMKFGEMKPVANVARMSRPILIFVE